MSEGIYCDLKKTTGNVVYTVTANCQDCYRCVRVCPVKAISVANGQAAIEDDLCIKCGTCVRECPQQAKTIRSSLDYVKELIETREKVAISVAPSFASVFRSWRSAKLPAALAKLGFGYVSETAEGAKLVTEETLIHSDKGSICTACPAVVNYIEKYRPEYIDRLIPVVSPMVAHGRMLKKRLGQDWTVVFVGPCAAKKQEVRRPENADAVDAVLTFTELLQWLEEENIGLASLENTEFESYGVLNHARLFPLQGGLLKTGDIECDGTGADVLHISGPEEIIELFNIPAGEWPYRYVEPLFCSGGCINGPGFLSERNMFLRKNDIVEYAKKTSQRNVKPIDRDVTCEAIFLPDLIKEFHSEISESRILEIMEQTGKSSPELQLNCGACGYHTCRDKAIAVAKGMAEPEMCMPYMRRLAQQRTDRIIETSPNGVVILDDKLNIINMNPAFQKMFKCTNAVLGRRISYLIDADGFEKLVVGTHETFECIKRKYGIKYHELVYTLKDEKQYVGIYMDISKIKFDNAQLDLIKRQTLDQARELLSHQISFSQEMAHYLGKSTAQSETMLRQLMNLFQDDKRQE